MCYVYFGLWWFSWGPGCGSPSLSAFRFFVCDLSLFSTSLSFSPSVTTALLAREWKNFAFEHWTFTCLCTLHLCPFIKPWQVSADHLDLVVVKRSVSSKCWHPWLTTCFKVILGSMMYMFRLGGLSCFSLFCLLKFWFRVMFTHSWVLAQ